MITVRPLLALLAISSLPFAHAASISGAADAAGPAGRPRFMRDVMGRAPVGLLAAIDMDKNGVISAAELANAPTLLQALDLNDDGVLSSAELRGFTRVRTTSPGIPRGARPVFAHLVSSAVTVASTLDANHDGEIQTMEIANAVLSLKSLDTNGDGQLTADELEPAAVAPRSVA